MIFYTENNEILKYSTNHKIGGESCGIVYKINSFECFKKFKSKNFKVDREVLLLIQQLGLENFCKIKRLLYGKNKNIIGYLMEYYQSENIDILTMPVEYTIENLCGIYNSVIKLSQNNIFINDMHTGNVILNSNKITIIDYDLYVLNGYFTGPLLKHKNIYSLMYLFKEIYKESLVEFHSEYNSDINRRLIDSVFGFWTKDELEASCKKLTRYKYPIDYIKKGNL